MKRVEVDTNFNWLGPSNPAMSEREISENGLSVGERVIAYQDDDEWDGLVSFDQRLPEDYRWYITIT